MPITKRPLLIDTDLNFDDAMAIVFLLLRPDVDVRAITLSGTGLTRLPAGAQNALRLLELTGHPIIPVASGPAITRGGSSENALPQEWRDDADTLLGLNLPEFPKVASPLSAEECICKVLESSTEKVSILAIGPLTNLAEALAKNPHIAQNIERITIMGGALQVAGNVERDGYDQVAEWNIFQDPLAAQEVFATSIPITLVPLDATNDAPVTQKFYERLSQGARTAPARFVARGISELAKQGALDDWYYFWDPLAAALVVNPDIVSTVDATVSVVIEEGPNRGRILIDSSGRKLQVASKPDQRAFENYFLQTLNTKAAPAKPRLPKP